MTNSYQKSSTISTQTYFIRVPKYHLKYHIKSRTSIFVREVTTNFSLIQTELKHKKSLEEHTEMF